MWQAKLIMTGIEQLKTNKTQITCTLFRVTPCICSTSLLSRGHEFDTRHTHLPLCDLLAQWSMFQHILEPSHDKRMQYAAQNKTKVRGPVVQTTDELSRSETVALFLLTSLLIYRYFVNYMKWVWGTRRLWLNFSQLSLLWNKKFWQKLIAYFPLMTGTT
jgi:hypothetical protein